MERILIIGGTGTISWSLVQALAQREDVALTLLNRGNRKLELPERCQTLHGDAYDEAGLVRLLSEHTFDTVIHFLIFNEEQARQSIRCFAGKVRRFFFISTEAVYDHELGCIMREDVPQGNRLSEYGRNKSAAEAAFREAYRNAGFPVIIVRPTQTYSRDRIPLGVKGKNCWTVVSRMLRGKEVIVHGDGQSLWASTHAEDFARGFLGLLDSGDQSGRAFQIMNPEPHTWDMLYRDLADQLGVPYRPVYLPAGLLARLGPYAQSSSVTGDKQFSNLFQIDALKSVAPDFHCEVSLHEGLRRYLAFMEEHPELKVEDPDYDHWCDHVIEEWHRAAEAFVSRFSD